MRFANWNRPNELVPVRGRYHKYFHRLINKEEAERKKQNRVSRTRTWSIGRLLEANELLVWVGVKKRVPEQLTTRGLACVEWSGDAQSRESEGMLV